MNDRTLGLRIGASVLAVAWLVISSGVSNAGQYSVLHVFTGGQTDGSDPQGGLTLVGSTLYGTTHAATQTNVGTLYSLELDGSNYQVVAAAQVFGPLSSPSGDLVASGSTLYGATYGNGLNALPSGNGTVYSINTDGTNLQLLQSFIHDAPTGGASDGGLAISGTTLYGAGRTGGASDDGTIFSINTDGTGYTILHSFAGFAATDGMAPSGGLLLVGSQLYGATASGGATNSGTIFSINTDGSNYHSFSPPGSGLNGVSGLSDGLIAVGSTLYGVAKHGGTHDHGAVYAMNLDGTNFHVVYSFNGPGIDGGYPFGHLTSIGSTLFGTSEGDTTNGTGGTLFSVSTDGSNFQVLHTFVGGPSDGQYPQAGLTAVGATVYGTTASGGTGSGTVFAYVVPEPGTIVLGAISLLALGLVARRRRFLRQR